MFGIQGFWDLKTHHTNFAMQQVSVLSNTVYLHALYDRVNGLLTVHTHIYISIYELQTEATPPAASCPARSLHATEIVSINTIPMTCPRLHWTTDNPSGMHGCQFQHLHVLILNCALALAKYIFVGLNLMLWHRKRI